jgi:BirA family biotin operon repressor/biotin-[acetyl-CoA-carboxylase] ligase
VFDPLPTDLDHALAAADPPLGDFANLCFAHEVASTNDLALDLAAHGAPAGASVLAGAQRAGRGRRGHSWFSPPGAGLYLSIVVRPRVLDHTLPVLTLVAGIAAAEAISRATALPIELKWPNDLVVGRPWRKAGGILCEAAGAGSRIEAVVIGIGVNLSAAAYPPEIADRATSLETELGRSVDRAALVVALLGAVRRAAARLDADGRAWVRDAWKVFGGASLEASPVRWREHGEWRRGIARDLDEDGALVVDAAGTRTRIVAGDVTWERLSRASEDA